MAKTTNTYDDKSIVALKGAERVRTRPAVIFGSDGLEGCKHAMFEILSNSIDEARDGYGKKIEVVRYLDHSIEVTDNGRGIPVDFNPNENRYNWELVFCELYAGGKYKKNTNENYEYSLGTNGLGTCATQYASEYMDAVIVRNGYRYSLHFEKGCNVGGLQKEETTSKKTGTSIRWLPDRTVFKEIDIPLDYYLDILEKQSIVNAGVLLVLRSETAPGKFDQYEFCYPNGIQDYLKKRCGDETLTFPVYYETEDKGRDAEDRPEYKAKISVCFCFTNTNAFSEYYHNSSYLEHLGSSEKAVRSAFVSAIDAYLKQNGKYNKKESKITFDDISDSLALVSNTFSSEASYENQTKKSFDNKFIQECMTAFLRRNLEVFFIENKADAERIANQVLINKRSRESAERARVESKKKFKESITLTNRVQKFVDCRTKDVTKRELFIVEGDSAKGSCQQARDAEFQAIMPIRGKILNCLKADYHKIFQSEIITDLIKVLGCGVEIRNKHSKNINEFDINSLRWSKVIICTDADVDGFQIRTLVLTMLYRLVPTLIEQRKVFIAETPLFEITTKSKTYFAYNEREKTEILQELGDTKYTIQRSKGLGENDPEMMSLTTMHPKTRRLISVLPSDALAAQEMFELLLGDNIQGRKEMIATHGKDYLDLADIS